VVARHVWGALASAGAFLSLVGSPTAAAGPHEPISLAGQWAFELDPKGVGITEGWFARDLDDLVELPGSTDENGKGTPNTRPPDLNGLSRAYEYVGRAWYQRRIEIPDEWAGLRLVLFLERCHWETRVWLDGRDCGTENSLCVPHEHELGIGLRPGKHRLTLCVDNTLKLNMGGAAHSTSEQTQTNWNGVVGRIELRATPATWIAELQAYPDLHGRTVRVRAAIASSDGAGGDLGLAIREPATGNVVGMGEVRVAGAGPVETRVALDSAPRLWDEFSPHRYEIVATLRLAGGAATDERRALFGMRELSVRDKRLRLNGRPIFLRGTLECCIFPLTGYPAMDVGDWLRIFRIARSYGLNHMRFHSWCPPEAAFEAADRMGFLLHVEAPQWTSDVGQDPPRDEFIRQEVMRILDAYGNHPSFGMLCMGNELTGDVSFLQKLVLLGREHDPRHLYTSSTAWSFGPNDQYNVAVVRGLHGPTTDVDFADAVRQSAVPLVSHEVGQWTVFPHLKEIGKYTGVLRPRNLELIRESLQEHHLLERAEDFTRASGRLSMDLYKEEIEVLLRTPGLGGFQLLDLHDFPGQGTALVGMLDAFWDSKDLVTPAGFRRFCGPTVVLARMKQRTYTTAETLEARVQVAHFGAATLTDVAPRWTLSALNGRIVASGELSQRDIRAGGLADLGAIEVPLGGVQAPSMATLEVRLPGLGIANDWSLWVYPPAAPVDEPQEVRITESVSEALEALDAGARVLLLPRGPYLVRSRPGSFTPVFWSPVWFSGAARGTMGIVCDPKHPALAEFPTGERTNWQWYDLLQRSRTMVIDGFPADLQPIVQVIDNFTTNQRLANLFEARIGRGRLVVCSIDLASDLEARPVARQLRRSILAYMGSDSFDPRERLTRDELLAVVREQPTSVLRALGAKVAHVDSEDAAHGNVAANAIDGDPDTFWHTEWGAQEPGLPHELVIDAGRAVEIHGFRYLPRQDMSNGWFAGYEIAVSDDGTDWGAPVAAGEFAFDADEKRVELAAPVVARYVRLRALTGYQGKPWTGVAEFDVVTPAPRR